jgi:spore coat protein U-like protein
LIEKVSFNFVILRISSVPNLIPGTYTFTLTVTLQYDN